MFRMAVGFQSLTLLLATSAVAWCQSGDQFIVHDAEFYVLKAQNAEKWAAEDRTLDVRLAELREKHGGPPNIVYVLWDDTPFGDVGIPHLQKIRGFETPRMNQMAREGIFFTRM